MSPEAPAPSEQAAAPKPRLGRWRWLASAVAIVLAAMAARATWEQHDAWARAVEAEHAGRHDDAIAAYRWVLRWHTPWGPHQGDAAEALWQLADAAEAQHPERAVFALDALRSGLIASRWLWQPQAARLQAANERIPGLLVRVAERRGDPRPKDELLRRFAADYARPVGVPGWVSLLVGGGFLLWLGGMALAWSHGLDASGRLARAGWRWVGASAAGWTMWLAGLWLA